VHTSDPSWAGTDAAVWSMIEVHTAILCSSLPTLRPLIKRFIPSLLSSRRPSEYGRIQSASKLANVIQTSFPFPDGRAEGPRDSDMMSKNDFRKGKTCITKCTTGNTASQIKEDDLELGETKGRGQPAGILVRTETVVHEEVN